MRHTLVHTYSDISLQVLWEALQDDLTIVLSVVEHWILPTE